MTGTKIETDTEILRAAQMSSVCAARVNTLNSGDPGHTNTMYVLTEVNGANPPSWLHALNVTTGADNIDPVGVTAPSRDQAHQALKLTAPTIANGHVFVPTATELDVWSAEPVNAAAKRRCGCLLQFPNGIAEI
jgi:hypothetical protein